MKGVYDVKIFTDEFIGSVRKIVQKKALIITASSLVGITAIGIGFRSAYLAGQNSVLPVSALTESSSSTISISVSSSLSDSNSVSASSSVQSASASASASSTKTSSSSKRSNDFPTVATAPRCAFCSCTNSCYPNTNTRTYNATPCCNGALCINAGYFNTCCLIHTGSSV